MISWSNNAFACRFGLRGEKRNIFDAVYMGIATMLFEPGNRYGALKCVHPTSRVLSADLRLKLNFIDKRTGEPWYSKLNRKILEGIERGEVWAISLAYDRVEGRALQHSEVRFAD